MADARSALEDAIRCLRELPYERCAAMLDRAGLASMDPEEPHCIPPRRWGFARETCMRMCASWLVRRCGKRRDPLAVGAAMCCLCTGALHCRMRPAKLLQTDFAPIFAGVLLPSAQGGESTGDGAASAAAPAQPWVQELPFDRMFARCASWQRSLPCALDDDIVGWI